MVEQVVVVGAGQAGAQVAISLRQMGFAGRIQLLGDEPHPPYQRPPLSKKLLTGELAVERAFIKPLAFYGQSGIELHPSVRVEAIERAQARVRLVGGRTLGYDRLVLATGTRARRIAVPGADLEGVHYLRTLDDAAALRASGPGRAVIIGGGYIGLEVAASLRQMGAEVTVLEALPRVLSRVVAEPVAAFFTDFHRQRGVKVMPGMAVAAIEGNGRVEAVLCTDGSRFEADLVVVGIGAVANAELAEAAGLAVQNGIVVDAVGRTEDPMILAAGDVTNHPSNVYGRRLRLESVHNAMAQAKAVAAAIVGREEIYDEVPWFWSDQYELKLQIAGLSDPADQTLLRGDPASHAFSCLYLRDGRLRALDAINRPADFIAAKRLIKEQRPLDPGRAADLAIRLGD